MKELLKQALALNDEIQTVGVINTQEYTLTSFRNKNSRLTEREEEDFTLRQLKISGIQKNYEKNFGKIKSSFVFHDKSKIMFFYIRKYIFFIICGKENTRSDFLNLVDRFEKILTDSTDPELAKTKYVSQVCEDCSRTRCLKGCICPCHDKLMKKIMWDLDYF